MNEFTQWFFSWPAFASNVACLGVGHLIGWYRREDKYKREEKAKAAVGTPKARCSDVFSKSRL